MYTYLYTTCIHMYIHLYIHIYTICMYIWRLILYVYTICIHTYTQHVYICTYIYIYIYIYNMYIYIALHFVFMDKEQKCLCAKVPYIKWLFCEKWPIKIIGCLLLRLCCKVKAYILSQISFHFPQNFPMALLRKMICKDYLQIADSRWSL